MYNIAPAAAAAAQPLKFCPVLHAAKLFIHARNIVVVVCSRSSIVATSLLPLPMPLPLRFVVVVVVVVMHLQRFKF